MLADALPEGAVAETLYVPATSGRSKESATVPSAAAVKSTSCDHGSLWSSSTTTWTVSPSSQPDPMSETDALGA